MVLKCNKHEIKLDITRTHSHHPKRKTVANCRSISRFHPEIRWKKEKESKICQLPYLCTFYGHILMGFVNTQDDHIQSHWCE